MNLFLPLNKILLTALLSIILFNFTSHSQTILIDDHFNTSILPDGVTTDGTMNPTKAADGVCSKGMVQVNKGGFMQVDVLSSSQFIVNMKSTASSTRLLTIEYKKEGEIDYTKVTENLAVSIATSFNLTELFPDLISNVPISVLIKPTNGNIQIHDLYVLSGTSSSTSAEITSFKVADQIGEESINSAAATISINVALGTNLTSVTPQSITISKNASITPSATEARDFTSPVEYTVLAEDGITTKTWTVALTRVSSPAKEITNFKLSENQIGSATISSAEGKITVRMPKNANLTNLIPVVLEISDFATISPSNNTPRDFSLPVIYQVTAQDNSTREWTVNVVKVNTDIDFEKVIGFAAMSGDGWTGPTTGGQGAADTLFINSTADFNTLCESLYYRQRAFKNGTPQNGMTNSPLVIYLKAGIYDGTQSLSTEGSKAFGNSMLDIAEQGNLTFIGESNVIFKIGINIKRSWNVLIRNIHFQDYYDDGINVGYPETHHIWIDHCTLGSPLGLPANSEHPDGGLDVKDGASYVTISWCVFQNSWKTSLVGHSDNNGSIDIGRLKVTYVNNYFKGTNSRNPRVRFGEVHVLNNLFENIGLYGIAAANSAYVLAENNFFLNTRWGMYADRTSADFKAVFGNNSDNVFTSKTGNIPALGLKQTGNAFDDSGLPLITAQINPDMLNPSGRSVKFDELNPESVFDAHTYYEYVPMSAEQVKDIVPQLAGADAIYFGPLPLKLHTFNAVLTNNEVVLTWVTSDEQNTTGFDLERSSDGNHFYKIGAIPSFNSKSENYYSYKDRNPLKGVSFYRLRQNDLDGHFAYSKIVSVNNKSLFSITMFPNPAVNKITINHERLFDKGVFKIMSVNGQVFKMQAPSSGTNTTIDISSLPKGNYVLQYHAGVNKTSIRFVKQ